MRTHKNSLSLFMLLMVALSSLTLFTGIGNPYQDGSARGKQDEATAVQTRMSEKQRAHSKLYKEYKPDVNLRALAESSHEDVEVVNGIPPKAFSSSSPPFNLQDFLRDLASKSDAIVIGAVNTKTSFLTSKGSFLLDGDKAIKLTHEDLPYEMETEAGALSLIARIRSAI